MKKVVINPEKLKSLVEELIFTAGIDPNSSRTRSGALFKESFTEEEESKFEPKAHEMYYYVNLEQSEVTEYRWDDDELDKQLSEKEFMDLVLKGVPIDRHRLTKLREKPERDLQLMGRIHTIERRYAEVLRLPEAAPARWLLQELRVSLFAQHLGTAEPVSEHRVAAELNRISPPT